MLQAIRESTQGWIAGVIISIICLSFALWGIHSYFTGGSVSTTVAEVNGQEISKRELNIAYERLRRQDQSQFNPSETRNDVQLKKDALQALIELEVLKQASINQGFFISEQQVDAYLQSMPDFQVNGEFSLDKFQQAMSSSLLDTADFLALIKTSLLIEQPQLGVTLTSFATPKEVERFIALVDEEREVDYVSIHSSNLKNNNIDITMDEIKQYYDANKTTFMSPEQVKVSYVELSLKNLAEKIQPTDSMLNKYYTENKSAYTKSKSWKLEEIRIPIAEAGNSASEEAAKAEITDVVTALDKGASFSKYAAKYQSNQSYLGKHAVTSSMLPVEIQAVVAELYKPGDYTRPIKLNNAYVILKATDVSEESIIPLANVKDRVKADYVRQHAEEKFAELRERLADIAYERPESLSAVSEQLGLTQKTSEYFSKDQGGHDVSQYQAVRTAAFGSEVLESKNNSEVIQLSPEAVAVVRVDDHRLSAQQPLSVVEPQIVATLKAQKQEARLQEQASQWLADLKKGMPMENLLKVNHLKLHKMGYLGRYSTRVDSAILDLAFQLPKPATVKQKATYGMTKTPDGYAVVILKNVKSGATSEKQKRKVFAEQAQNSEGALEYLLYKNSEMESAKIKVNEAA